MCASIHQTRASLQTIGDATGIFIKLHSLSIRCKCMSVLEKGLCILPYFCRSRSGTERGPDYKSNWTIFVCGWLSGYVCGSMMIGVDRCWSLIGQNKCTLQTSAAARLTPGT